MSQNLTHHHKPTQDGHIDIEDYQIGIQFFRFVDGVLSVHCFAADFQIRLDLQSVSDTTAQHFVIVRDENSVALGVAGCREFFRVNKRR